MVLAELLDKGGIVMVILLLLSIYVLAIVLFKIFQLWKLNAFKTGFTKSVIKNFEAGNITKAKKIAQIQNNPIARVVEYAISVASTKSSKDEKIKTIEATGQQELRIFDSYLRGLEMSASVAPLLGLLGTVIGMVKAFAGIDQVGSRVDPSILAGGIWEALLTTVVGLSIAIPALIAHYAIESKIEKLKALTVDTVNRIIY